MKRFEAGTRVIAGSGAVAALKELGAKRLLVVTDPFFRKNGTAAQVAQCAGAEQVAYFDEVAPDPSVELAAKGTAALQAFRPDTVVALGGGSTMDCAKAMLYFSGSDACFVAIPTTSGSGSEVTNFAVLTHGGVKHPLVDRRLRPAVAILDDTLLRQLPGKLVADAGFDVVSHALEAYVATDAGLISDALARDAFCTACRLLPASYRGDVRVRLELHTAATMAGMAFTQAGLGLCHGLAHSLGGLFHVTHGRLNAILLPAVLRHNAPAAAEKYRQLACAVGLPGSARTVALRSLENALVQLRRELAMPDTLQQAGISPAALRQQEAQLVEATLADPCCATNPRPVEPEQVRSILRAVAGHG